MRVFSIVKHSRPLLVDLVQIPMVVLSLLVCVWTVNLAILQLPFTFPASVTCLLILFIILLIFSAILGQQRVAVPLKYLEPTSDFLLKWISLFFCPPFILLPVSNFFSGITGIDVGKIASLFIVSFLVFIVLAWAFVTLCSFISPFRRKEPELEMPPDNSNPPEDIEMSNNVSVPSSTRNGMPEMQSDPPETPTNEATSTTNLNPQIMEVSSDGSPLRRSSVANASPQDLRRIYTALYSAMFLISLPVFYKTSYSMPLFLSLTVLSFFFSVYVVPAQVRRVLHPILTCSLISILVIWGLGTIHGWTLTDSLHSYTTGTKYLALFGPTHKGGAPLPGAGDVLSSILDASIVSLAVPMYRYRGELKRHAFELLGTVIPLAVLSIFIYPLAARAITLSPSRALAFAARSVTTPLALPMEASLAGDASLTVVLCILTGILGALAGPSFLRLLRVKDSDYITIGVVLGCTASAISTASLLNTNPRAAAISSLSFVLYGVICVILSSIPPVVELVQKLAGV